MSKVIGIDVSTKKIACILLDGDTWRNVEFISKSKTWDARLDDLQEQFWFFVRDFVKDDDEEPVKEASVPKLKTGSYTGYV